MTLDNGNIHMSRPIYTYLNRNELIRNYFHFGEVFTGSTVIFILAVSSAVLLHDVSARAGDVSMGITVFPIG